MISSSLKGGQHPNSRGQYHQNLQDRATIFYNDIGDYLNQDEKLAILNQVHSINNKQIKWKSLKPNSQGDWINKRNTEFKNYLAIGDKNDKNTFFNTFSNGIKTNRDAWVYSSSINKLKERLIASIEYYNEELKSFLTRREKEPELIPDNFLDFDSKDRISWSADLVAQLYKGTTYQFNESGLRMASYRPFMKMNLYLSRVFNNSVYQIPKYFPNKSSKNTLICLTGTGSLGFSVLMTELIPDLCLTKMGNGGAQCFPLYYYEERQKNSPSLFDAAGESEYIRRDGVSDFILERAKKVYGKNVGKEDIFYYVYGILHSPDYRTAFANDLKKMLPRIPLVEDVRDFWKFSKAGRQLADLHINYENVPAYKDAQETGADSGFYRVEKMRFPNKGQKDTIIYNSKIIISNIPDKAYEYIVNGKSVIEWIMERYQVKVDKASGIKNDPNDWSDEVGNPRYILDLLLSIINVSVQTVEIVEGLPGLEFD